MSKRPEFNPVSCRIVFVMSRPGIVIADKCFLPFKVSLVKPLARPVVGLVGRPYEHDRSIKQSKTNARVDVLKAED